jgi:3-hydroxypropanoate dehydrogenase
MTINFSERDFTAQSTITSLRKRITKADPATLDLILREARTHYGWQDKTVSDDLIHELYDLTKMGPTSMNQQSARFVFIRSAEAKKKLMPTVMEGNRAKVEAAPLTVIIAYDMAFYEKLPKVLPVNPSASQYFVNNPALTEENGLRNSTLQGAWLIMAARALGLDAGPMSGFDAAAVNSLFFAGTTWKANFLCNIGYGNEKTLFGRLPRLDFDEVAQIV